MYYMANPVLGKFLCSDWFFLGQDFAVRTVSMEMVQSEYFCFGAKPPNSKFATKTAKKCENCHSSHWNYQQKLKRLKFFRNFKDGWRRRTFFKCKPPEVHLTIRNGVPYNKLLTTRACSRRTGEYWPSVVFVQTLLRSVHTVTTLGQYSPVRPLHSVSINFETLLKDLLCISPLSWSRLELYDNKFGWHVPLYKYVQDQPKLIDCLILMSIKGRKVLDIITTFQLWWELFLFVYQVSWKYRQCFTWINPWNSPF